MTWEGGYDQRGPKKHEGEHAGFPRADIICESCGERFATDLLEVEHDGYPEIYHVCEDCSDGEEA